VAEIYRLLLAFHVAVALAALAAFWLAALTRKAGAAHRSFGGVFVGCMAATLASATALSALLLLDPLAARPPGAELAAGELDEYRETLRGIASGLLEVSLASGALLHFGATALRRRGPHAREARRRAIGVAGSALFCGGLLLLAGLAGAMLVAVAALELRALLRRERRPQAWLVEHLAGMLGAGAFANGALAVNVARHFTEDVALMFLPGVAVVGIFAAAIALLARKLGRRPGPAPGSPPRKRPAPALTLRPDRA
jgi:hypothetical protein